MIKPDLNCPDCKGQGSLYSPSTEQYVKCKCLLLKEAVHYLTPYYQKSVYWKDLPPAKFNNNDLIFESNPIGKFKSFVKSYLLNTAMKYTHLTVSPYDILQAYLGNSEEASFSGMMSKVDILIIIFETDPNNGHYGLIIKSLIEKRRRYNKNTFIFSSTLVKSNAFVSKYQTLLTEYIESSFNKIKI